MNPDMHMHTLYSHGKNKPSQMYESALAKGISVIGFSEHSPRPGGYDYTREYREQLSRHFPDYIREVRELGGGSCEALLGLEVDWLPAEKEFVRASCKAYDYDYLIGSVHFIDHWGFDDVREKWNALSQEECEIIYRKYFANWLDMIQSGLFQIAAHPDLIKIFSVGQFREWLRKSEAVTILQKCLRALRDAGMAMEISSAGLRKPCVEIYPAPAIMAIAADAGVRVSLASDAHAAEDIGYAFPELAAYARSFGFTKQTVFHHGAVREYAL